MDDIIADDVRVRRERDYLLRLLELGQHDDVSSALEAALSLMLEISGAEQGLLQVQRRGADPTEPPAWTCSHAYSDDQLSSVRSLISRGVIAEALARGETIETASALGDARFDARESVRRNEISAVLCAPIGTSPVLGVVYLQRRQRTGAFGRDVRRFAELFAQHAAPVIERFVARATPEAADDADPTAAFRRSLLGHGALAGRSRALSNLFRQVVLIAPLELTALITGPSGSGKTEVARLLAANSARADGPFVELNCAALPDELLESELFGARQGAHSTARTRVSGKVEAAEAGTLFLDEIGDLSLRAQAKILQLVQEKVYFPLGASRPVTANVRIVAATNVDLEQRVREKRFREDLYYRLAVLPIRVPGLAERREDIAPLLRHFATRAATRHGLPALAFSEAAVALAEITDWPGQVRQLAHQAEAAVIRAFGDGLAQITPDHLFPASLAPTTDTSGVTTSFQEATRSFQRTVIAHTLASTAWNVSEAARRLGLARSHVYTLIRDFDLQRD